MPFDIIRPDGVAVAIHDAIGDVMCPEQIGRLVELLVLRGILDEEDLRVLLPQGYQIRQLLTQCLVLDTRFLNLPAFPAFPGPLAGCTFRVQPPRGFHDHRHRAAPAEACARRARCDLDVPTGPATMTIQHPPVDAASDEAFVFADLGGFTCSICAPVSWDVGRVIAFAEEKFPSSGERWVSVDTAKLFTNIASHTPNPCNGAPTQRMHWFMMRGYSE